MKIHDKLFWDRTAHMGTCRIWEGAANRKGYGIVRRLGRTWIAHRYALYLLCGEDKPNAIFKKSCTNTLCVNPHHLKEQTASERIGKMLRVRWEGEHEAESPKCVKCSSFRVMTNRKKRERWCRRCGHVWSA
jgi:hypothetical protein